MRDGSMIKEGQIVWPSVLSLALEGNWRCGDSAGLGWHATWCHQDTAAPRRSWKTFEFEFKNLRYNVHGR